MKVEFFLLQNGSWQKHPNTIKLDSRDWATTSSWKSNELPLYS